MAHKILIANRGEIALRIIRSSVKLGIPTVAIYTLADATSPHVSQANESYIIGDGTDARGYLDIDAILAIAKSSEATMVAPGYGFLSENAAFASACEAMGLIFLGPTPLQMTSMGLKHEARAVAIAANVPVVPGSLGAVEELGEAIRVANQIGYPVMVKASGGGGGMGMQVCKDEASLIANFEATKEKGAALFKESAVFLEKFITRARHVEVQIFGNGEGHQKVIEETPCVLFASAAGQGVRQRMCDAAVSLGRVIKYRSAGTVEFVLDVDSPDMSFYFLELNARIQVEHGITEAVRPGLDLVELMIRQGLQGPLSPVQLVQTSLDAAHGHAIEARIYCENPKAGFKPSPGQLHHVQWADVGPGGRIDTWVSTGTLVTSHYDPMIAKVIAHGDTREAAISQMARVLSESRIVGPPTNLDYCRTIVTTFAQGAIHTTFLDTYEYSPSAVEVLSPGLLTTVQDLPGRFVGLGIPRGGAADMLALQAANILVGNHANTEGLEMTMIGPTLLFHAESVIAVAGCDVQVTMDGVEVPAWTTLHVKRGQILRFGTAVDKGLRFYLAIRGGLPGSATFMGSKSTFKEAGLGGHQGRALVTGDLLEIVCASAIPIMEIPRAARPPLTHQWAVEVCVGPQWDPTIISSEGMATLLETKWEVTPASNRSGLRLQGPRIKWARSDGGEGGAHPSNVVDQGYPFGALNINGDTPVLFGVDAPDMGGFACLLTIATGSAWKLGQVRPGDTVQFICISGAEAATLEHANEQWLSTLSSGVDKLAAHTGHQQHWPATSVLRRIDGKVERTFRQAGDRFMLYEVGPMVLDIAHRVRVELWERALRQRNVPGIVNLNSCVRSCMVHFDPAVVTVDALLDILVAIDIDLPSSRDIRLDSSIVRMPIVPDDQQCQDAVDFYMKTSREKAVYLPNNTQYVARNNGVEVSAIVDALTKTPWLVLARGFFCMLPFIIPLDPCHRLLAQKYNPSRTRTPEGAVGLAGVVGSIYPMASAGGYQLLGRTLTTWQAWSEQHSLVENFDQIEFYPVSEGDMFQIERQFKAGLWKPQRRQATFTMSQYERMVSSKQAETEAFQARQRQASAKLAIEEEELFADYLKCSQASPKQAGTVGSVEGTTIPSPLAAAVYKILVKPGDVILSDDTAVVELEAMKTSVFVTAGADMAGRRVRAVLVSEGDAVAAGTALLAVT